MDRGAFEVSGSDCRAQQVQVRCTPGETTHRKIVANATGAPSPADQMHNVKGALNFFEAGNDVKYDIREVGFARGEGRQSRHKMRCHWNIEGRHGRCRG